MLAPDPTQRPEIKTMLQHPLLWDKEKRADFLCEVNNMLQELPVNSAEVVHLDSFNNDVITDWVYDGWLDRFHHDFLNEVTFQNNGFKYRWFELRELFRFVRNMLQHFNYYSLFMGSSLDSAYEYLLDELPELILISYEIVKQGNHAESDRFKRFFKEAHCFDQDEEILN
ncbi:sensor for unfolded proteins in the ER ire1-like isoform X2 [Trifolium pratense]|uniref:sensor for unfolded proteins in the ER ire1-like isoform X2 n=1 Tax=Trifolium pratense TaxID=57577 RepID=UPI001E696C4E|nr:sensor for unfolded proteins in the ER ire1-like isoform X2 [Trifolium pratense]